MIPGTENQPSSLPAIWGGKSMRAMNAIIGTKNDCVYLCGPGGYQIDLSPGSTRHENELSDGGHWMLPCSDCPEGDAQRADRTGLSFVEGDFFKNDARQKEDHEDNKNRSAPSVALASSSGAATAPQTME